MAEMGILTTQRLSKHFGGLQAIHEVDLEIRRGEILGLIGPNGSGKTTFINLVNGLLKPSGGKILFEGEEITGLPAHALAKKGIARTFQQNVLFKRTSLWNNVLIAHEANYRESPWKSFLGFSKNRAEGEEAQESTSSILGEMNLLAWKDKLCGDLPHGIQRMVEIAVASAVKPKLMLLDEPFAGMNLNEITMMIGLIERLKRAGVTILLVEHKMKIVMKLCERIVVFNFGDKIAEDLPEAIMRNKEVVKAYLGDTSFVL
jgi:branched-chain amino acid transport system ATP-binding protein